MIAELHNSAIIPSVAQCHGGAGGGSIGPRNLKAGQTDGDRISLGIHSRIGNEQLPEDSSRKPDGTLNSWLR